MVSGKGQQPSDGAMLPRDCPNAQVKADRSIDTRFLIVLEEPAMKAWGIVA
jgi:hypothetical protein